MVCFISDGDVLIKFTNTDGTFDSNIDNWTEVDELAILGEEQWIQDEIDRADNIRTVCTN